jgi:hypothetical protein
LCGLDSGADRVGAVVDVVLVGAHALPVVLVLALAVEATRAAVTEEGLVLAHVAGAVLAARTTGTCREGGDKGEGRKTWQKSV